MKIVVTGASGFVGPHLVAELLSAGHQPVLFGKKDDQVVVDGFGKLEVEALDILDSIDCDNKILKTQPDAIIHLAAIAQTTVKDSELVHKINVTGALNVANAFCKLNAKVGIVPKPFLFISSALVYGSQVQGEYRCSENTQVCPRGLYGQSKIDAEIELGRLSKDKISIYVARPFNHIGIGQGLSFVVPDLVKRFKEAGEKSEILTGNLMSYRDFTDVRDVVRAYRLIIEKRPIEKLFVIGSGKPRSIQSIFDLLNIYSKKFLNHVSSADLVRDESQTRLVADSSLAKRVLGWEASIPFETTLKEVWDYELKK